MLVLLDGLPHDSWYKQSVEAFMQYMAEEEERQHAHSVSSLIFAQLTGQEVTISDGISNP